MADKPKGAPPVTPKTKTREQLKKGSRAGTGGDPYDRSRGQYKKGTTNPKVGPLDRL